MNDNRSHSILSFTAPEPAVAPPGPLALLPACYQGKVKVLPLQNDFMASCTPSL